MSNPTNGPDVGPDASEPIRRAMIEAKRAIGPLTRDELATVHGEVMDTNQLMTRYRVMQFMAPFVVVERRIDGKLGTLEFQPDPRFYYGWTPDTEE